MTVERGNYLSEPVDSAKALNLQETSQRPPFVIRGHRLYSSLFQPRLFQENGNRWVKNQIREVTRAIRFRRGYSLTEDYSVDILGKNPSNFAIAKYNKKLDAYMTEFMGLEEESHVQLVRTPDGICEICATGRHCIDRSNADNPDSHHESTDKEAIEEFIKVIEWLGRREGVDYSVKMKPRRKRSDIESVITTKKILVVFINHLNAYRIWNELQNEAEYEKYMSEAGQPY